MEMDRTNYSAEVVAVETLWQELDVTGSGQVSLTDVSMFLLKASRGLNVSEEGITDLLAKADQNKDGYLQKEEFFHLMLKVRRTPLYRRLLFHGGLLVVPRRAQDLQVRTYLQEFNCLPPPFFMVLVSLAELGVFIYYATLLDEPVTANGPTPFKSPLIYNPFRRYEAWRYVSYMLLHSGYMHLINNLLVQLVLGILLEVVHKFWRVALIYLVGVFAGCLASSLTSPSAYLLGASGGVYAVEYAHMGNLLLNWSEMRFAWIQTAFLGLISILDFGFAIWDTYFSQSPSSTGHVAHLAGALAGFLMGVVVLRNLKKRRWERTAQWICLGVLVVLVGAAVIVQVAYPGYFPQPDHSPLHGY